MLFFSALSVFCIALCVGVYFYERQSFTVHTDIYKLCTAQPQAFSEQLYHRLKKFLEDHVDRLREVFLAQHYLTIFINFFPWSKYWIHKVIYLVIIWNVGGNIQWVQSFVIKFFDIWYVIYYFVCGERGEILFVLLFSYWFLEHELDTKAGERFTKQIGECLSEFCYIRHLRSLHSMVVVSALQFNYLHDCQLSLIIWRERLFMKVRERLLRAVEELITKDRDGEQISPSQVSGLVQCLSNFLLYPLQWPLSLQLCTWAKHTKNIIYA